MERLTYKSQQPNLDREMPVWTGETDDKQHGIHAKDEELLYMAAITA
ncbi:hypothetical protein ACDW82_01780 [Alcaligenes faecalis]|nr:hypothetical protein [Alcaligenes faecalis]